MKKRKTIKADAENKKSLFLLIGLTVSLAMTLFFLELKSYEGGPADLGRVDFQDDDEIAIPAPAAKYKFRLLVLLVSR